MGSQEKLDTRSTPYTMVWFSQPVRGLFPITRDITGQDEMIASAWHTPGKELKIETNLPEVQSMKVTSAGPTKKFEFNGKEVATVAFDSSSKKASHTMHLPSGKDLTIDLAWPKMTPAASDLEFGVTIRNMKVDAIVWKSFAGQKYGFTLTNDKFTLLAGKH